MGKKRRVTRAQERRMQSQEMPPYVGQSTHRVIPQKKRLNEARTLGITQGRSPTNHPVSWRKKLNLIPIAWRSCWRILNRKQGQISILEGFLCRGRWRRTNRDRLDLGGKTGNLRVELWWILTLQGGKAEKMPSQRRENSLGRKGSKRGGHIWKKESQSHMCPGPQRSAADKGVEEWQNDPGDKPAEKKRNLPEKQNVIKENPTDLAFFFFRWGKVDGFIFEAKNKGRLRNSLRVVENFPLVALAPFSAGEWHALSNIRPSQGQRSAQLHDNGLRCSSYCLMSCLSRIISLYWYEC